MKNSVKSGLAVSDLHMLALWSAADEHMDEVHAAAARSDIIVLNGDTFDFRWAALPTVEDAVRAAVDWLQAFLVRHPGCRVFYVLGNHDAHPLFVERLAALAREEGNLGWHASHLRIGENLFVHGDLSLKYPRKNPFARTLSARFWKTNRALRACYRLCIALGVHRLVARCHGKKRCAKRIVRSFEADKDGLTEGVTNVYFGHTHAAFSGYRYAGLTFHNTGSAIRGLELNVSTVRIQDTEGGRE
jgi:UDP-2,3-diacylglucosamine hydrolase